jgi:diguanylate cyclase (GGDEF)-like protein/PAS domain S-box-containing protein
VQLRIRTKLTVSVLFAALCFTWISFAAHQWIISPAFSRIEEGNVERDMERGINAFHNQINELTLMAMDYANWDNTWDFAVGKKPDYPTVDMSIESYQNAHWAFAAIIGLDSKPVLCSRLQGDSALVNWDAKFLHSLQNMASEGIEYTDQGPMVYSAVPILHSDMSGPMHGLFVIGRLIDSTLVKNLSRLTGVPIDIHDAIHLDTSQKNILSVLLQDGGRFMQKLPGNEFLDGYALIKNRSGVPMVILHSQTSREISVLGEHIGFLSVHLSMGLGFLLSLLLWIILNKIVGRPMRTLHACVSNYDLKENEKSGIESLEGRTDEIGNLAMAFHSLTSRLRVSHLQLQEQNDTLERKVVERTKDLQSTNHQLRLMGKVMEETGDGVLITDLEKNIQFVNDSLCRLSGYNREELMGKNPSILEGDRHDATQNEFRWASVSETGHWAGETWNRRPNGEIYPLWLSISTVSDDENRPSHYVGISADISNIKEAEKSLHKLAYYDILTGLPNRQLFKDRLQYAITQAQRYEHCIALLFIDLDRFKNVNDTMGHAVGDLLITEVGERLKGRVRESDTVCRLGGDEFTIILSKIYRNEDAAQVAKALIHDIRQPFHLCGRDVFVDASIGIAIYPEDDSEPEGLVRKADAAMYQSKEVGRGTFRFASAEIDDRNRKRLELEMRLRGAIDKNELSLHFQPQVSVSLEDSTFRQIQGVEALVRWNSPGNPPVGPDQFIPIAEDTGMIIPMGVWILDEACMQAARWAREGTPLRVAVNISARQFEDRHLPLHVEEALKQSGLDPSLLELELTESMFIKDSEHAIHMMNTLKNLGVTLAVDDFGTGYSCLSSLSRFPVDVLKIDKSFVDEMLVSSRGSDIIAAIISLARNLGLRSVAEGVETKEQLEQLRLLGCDEIQGYYFSRPLDSGRFQDFIEANITPVSNFVF